jgi:hypothetical protein
MRLATGAAYWVLAKRYSEAYREATSAKKQKPDTLILYDRNQTP